MANTREIRRRIKSIKNTSQITKAMQLVAASKMRRAQQLALMGRDYSALLNHMLVSIRGRTDENMSPFLEVRPLQRELVLVISTDKGLCGGLNTNLFREVGAFPAATTRFISVGKKAAQFLARTQRENAADFVLKDSPDHGEARAIADFCAQQFLNREVDKVTVVFTHFVNTLTQKATVRTLLPITDFAPEKHEGVKDDIGGFGYIFEPSPEDVLNHLLPQYLQYQIYQKILDSRASEHSARMVAMKSASDNAQQLVKDLTLEYNKVRQAAITTELLEISTAQAILG